VTEWNFDIGNGKIFALNVTVGHTGPWVPFVTVTTSDGYSKRFLDDWESFSMRPALIEQMRQAKKLKDANE
jgi:hypothetical protein